ncbi:MAG TPA: DoxX family protein, partial [Polyangiaceae bacterium]|nr:DoxX family protein [Polyangiaceae bacterium]
MQNHFSSRAVAWASSHRDVALDVMRIYLGTALFVRGVLIIDNPQLVGNYVTHVDWFWPYLVAHYVAMAHFGGGALLALGLVTRLAAAIQVPALVGAVFFVHIHDGLMSQSQSLELAVLVLFMLLVFMVFGAGRLSLDRYLFGVDVPD